MAQISEIEEVFYTTVLPVVGYKASGLIFMPN